MTILVLDAKGTVVRTLTKPARAAGKVAIRYYGSTVPDTTSRPGITRSWSWPATPTAAGRRNRRCRSALRELRRPGHGGSPGNAAAGQQLSQAGGPTAEVVPPEGRANSAALLVLLPGIHRAHPIFRPLMRGKAPASAFQHRGSGGPGNDSQTIGSESPGRSPETSPCLCEYGMIWFLTVERAGLRLVQVSPDFTA